MTPRHTIPGKKIEAAVAQLEKLEEDWDHERAHVLADEVLLELLPLTVREAFVKIEKWYA